MQENQELESLFYKHSFKMNETLDSIEKFVREMEKDIEELNKNNEKIEMLLIFGLILMCIASGLLYLGLNNVYQ